MKVLILGGSGVISREIVRQMVAAGHDVSVYNRGSKALAIGEGVTQLVGDRHEREKFEAAMQRTNYDAVIGMICFTADDARSTMRAFAGNAGHIVVTSSVAAYCRPYRRPYRSVPNLGMRVCSRYSPGTKPKRKRSIPKRTRAKTGSSHCMPSTRRK